MRDTSEHPISVPSPEMPAKMIQVETATGRPPGPDRQTVVSDGVPRMPADADHAGMRGASASLRRVASTARHPPAVARAEDPPGATTPLRPRRRSRRGPDNPSSRRCGPIRRGAGAGSLARRTSAPPSPAPPRPSPAPSRKWCSTRRPSPRAAPSLGSASGGSCPHVAPAAPGSRRARGRTSGAILSADQGWQRSNVLKRGRGPAALGAFALK